MTAHRGHCRCKGVMVEVTGRPAYSILCHCDDCRRSAGAPVIAAAGFENEMIEWKSRETLASWINGSCTRWFCKNCGSPVAQTHESAPTRTYFYTAFMEEPELFPPECHSFITEKLSWLTLKDNLPKHKRTASINLD